MNMYLFFWSESPSLTFLTAGTFNKTQNKYNKQFYQDL